MPRKKNQIIDQNNADDLILDQVNVEEIESETQLETEKKESETQLETTQPEIVQNIKEFSKSKRKITKLIETICGPKTIIVEVDE